MPVRANHTKYQSIVEHSNLRGKDIADLNTPLTKEFHFNTPPPPNCCYLVMRSNKIAITSNQTYIKKT